MTKASSREWTILTAHGACLIWLSKHPTATIREISDALNISERHVNRLVTDLRKAGYITVERKGRSSVYAVNESAHLRHDFLKGVSIEGIIRAVSRRMMGPVIASGIIIVMQSVTAQTMCSSLSWLLRGHESECQTPRVTSRRTGHRASAETHDHDDTHTRWQEAA
jgi:DNA-binding transcriptional ArsR family regulator